MGERGRREGGEEDEGGEIHRGDGAPAARGVEVAETGAVDGRRRLGRSN
jgi:hypothetical protein